MAQTMAIIILVITLITGIFWLFEKYKKIYINTDKKTKLSLNNYQVLQITPHWLKTTASFFPVFFMIFIIRSFIFEPFQIPSGSMIPTLLIGDFILVKKFSYEIKDPIFGFSLKNIGNPKRGDVVVFKYPLNDSLYYVKRIIGLPGDQVKYDYRNKKLTINKNFHQKSIVTYPKRIIDNFFQRTDNFDFYPKISDILKKNNNIINNYWYNFKICKENIDKVSYNILLLDNLTDKIKFYFHQKNNSIGTWKVPEENYFVMGDNRDNSADSRYWGFVPKKNLIGKATKIWFSLEKEENKWPVGIRFNRIGNIK